MVCPRKKGSGSLLRNLLAPPACLAVQLALIQGLQLAIQQQGFARNPGVGDARAGVGVNQLRYRVIEWLLLQLC